MQILLKIFLNMINLHQRKNKEIDIFTKNNCYNPQLEANKTNCLQTGSSFFRLKKTRRHSQLQNISDMLNIQTNTINKNPSSIFKCHFRKKINKIESNISMHPQKVKKRDKKMGEAESNNVCEYIKNKTQIGGKRDKKTNKEEYVETIGFDKQNKRREKSQEELKIKKNNKIYHRKTKTQNLSTVKHNSANSPLFPRFKKFQLFALYQSLLQYAHDSPTKFLKGFQSALSSQKIIIKSQIIKKKLWQNDVLTFQGFLETYKHLETIVFIQNIIDFFEIIFQPYRNCAMKIQVIEEIFMKRNSQKVSESIGKLIYQKLQKRNHEDIYLSQIIQLCHNNFEFCQNLTKLFSLDIDNSKIGNWIS